MADPKVGVKYETKHYDGREGWVNITVKVRPSQKRELIKAAGVDGLDIVNAVRKAIDDYIDG